MPKQFQIENFIQQSATTDQYERQLRRLVSAGKSVDCIESAVRGALENLSGAGRKSFVIYGEPQSGKTEMMICLTAKLLDEGYKFVLHLLNDSVDLLGQNLGRFQESGLAPSAQNYTDILDPAIQVRQGRHVIFCKKNASDLRKLINKIGEFKNIIVIDDEADFASPNSKVNQSEKTKINELITKILGATGDYIGVTATPARLDLNNTFENDSNLWVNFPAHSAYTGQDVFFPMDGPGMGSNAPTFQLTLIPDKDDSPKYSRSALFGFLINVSYLNKYVNNEEENYSMLVHTSGKKIDHKSDWASLQQTLAELSLRSGARFEKYVEEIWHLARSRYLDADPDELTAYILDNISRNSVILLNSDRDFKQNGKSATIPASLFTIIIGGNIVSRGVTFDNLLSMFFTRDVKHKIQQDTYIQRARMFGAREAYLRFFELTIPRGLYADWHRCFVFHRLALEAINNGKGSPVWLSDKRIAAVASASIDKSTVDIDRGEMSFQLFKLPDGLDETLAAESSNSNRLDKLTELLGDVAFPSYLKQFISRTSPSLETAVVVYPSTSIAGYSDEPGLDKKNISRRRGFFGRSQSRGGESVIHHLRIFFNADGYGRVFYKFDGSIQFIKNLR